jgi:hypothetical protein
MKAITVATHSERYFDILQESAKRNNIDLVVLGWGEQWKGYVWKFNLLIEYLKTCNDDEIILFIDGYDVFFIRSEEDIIQNFLELKNNNKNVKVFIGEDGKPTDIISKYIYNRMFPDTCKDLKINTGMYIGYAKDLRDMFDNLCNTISCNDTMNDQRLLGNYCSQNPDNFFIDTENKIFLNLFSDILNNNKIDFNNANITVDKNNKNGNYIKTFNNIYPCVIHGPGNANLEELFNLYGYHTKYKNTESSFNYLLKATKSYYNFFYLEICILLILIIGIIYCCNKIKF